MQVQQLVFVACKFLLVSNTAIKNENTNKYTFILLETITKTFVYHKRAFYSS